MKVMLATTALPTHTCFDDAWEFLESLGRKVWSGRYVMVHAIVEQVDVVATPQAHAWIFDQEENVVIERFLVEGVPVFIRQTQSEHATHLRVLDERWYSVREALEENYRTGHYGPWEEKFRQYCGNYKKKEG